MVDSVIIAYEVTRIGRAISVSRAQLTVRSETGMPFFHSGYSIVFAQRLSQRTS